MMEALVLFVFFFCTLFRYVIKGNHSSKNSCAIISNNSSDNVNIVMTVSSSMVWFSLGGP